MDGEAEWGVSSEVTTHRLIHPPYHSRDKMLHIEYVVVQTARPNGTIEKELVKAARQAKGFFFLPRSAFQGVNAYEFTSRKRKISHYATLLEHDNPNHPGLFSRKDHLTAGLIRNGKIIY